MNLISDPLFYAAAIPAVILTGISKGGLGLAGGLAVPIMALATSPMQAAAIMLPILCVMDLLGLYAYRKSWDRRNMKIILPAGILGIAIGWLTFRHMNEDWIRVLLGVIAVGFVLNALRSPVIRPMQPSARKGWFWSAVSGFTSFVAHAGGPPLSVYLLPQRLDKALHVGTTIVFFAVINAVKLVPYFALGLFDTRNLSTSMTLAPIGAAGIGLGIWLRTRISTTWFFRLAYTLLFITGAKLLYDGARNLLM